MYLNSQAHSSSKHQTSSTASGSNVPSQQYISNHSNIHQVPETMPALEVPASQSNFIAQPNYLNQFLATPSITSTGNQSYLRTQSHFLNQTQQNFNLKYNRGLKRKSFEIFNSKHRYTVISLKCLFKSCQEYFLNANQKHIHMKNNHNMLRIVCIVSNCSRSFDS